MSTVDTGNPVLILRAAYFHAPDDGVFVVIRDALLEIHLERGLQSNREQVSGSGEPSQVSGSVESGTQHRCQN